MLTGACVVPSREASGVECKVDGSTSACFEKAYFSGAVCDGFDKTCTDSMLNNQCTTTRTIHYLMNR